MAEIARHLLAVGARLAYGGDLRNNGFTLLLFELALRYGRDPKVAEAKPVSPELPAHGRCICRSQSLISKRGERFWRKPPP